MSVRVLVVDDSAYLRKVITRMLSTCSDIQVVGIASDGNEALEMLEEHHPDVITLDLEMPRCNGVDFLRTMGQERRVPVVVVSSLGDDTKLVIEAMEAGAFDFIQKPTSLANERLFEITQQLVAKVLSAAGLSTGQRRLLYCPPPARAPERMVTARGHFELVVVGISTGGPTALQAFLARFPATTPVPLLAVMHMPEGYTAAYCERLNANMPLEVLEAEQGLELRPGRAIIGRGGVHLKAARGLVHLDSEPSDLPHRPSVNVLFSSAVAAYRGRVLAVIMTGMGHDGTDGALAIKAAGGTVLVQSESTCVVYGMPRSAVEAGVVDEVVDLDDLAGAVMGRL